MAEYNALVLKRETGPIARCMEIIFSAILAKHLTGALAEGWALLMADLRLSSYHLGHENFLLGGL